MFIGVTWLITWGWGGGVGVGGGGGAKSTVGVRNFNLRRNGVGKAVRFEPVLNTRMYSPVSPTLAQFLFSPLQLSKQTIFSGRKNMETEFAPPPRKLRLLLL